MKYILVLDNYLFGIAYLQAAKKSGYKTILAAPEGLEDDKNSTLVDVFVSVDLTADPAKVTDQILDRTTNYHICAVLPGHVFHVLLQAKLSEKLGLKSISYNSARKCLNKKLFRECLKENNIPQGWFKSAGDYDPDRDFPCVIKPVEGFASIGVNFLQSAAEYRAFFNHTSLPASGIIPDEYIIEEALAGNEFSVETLIRDGIATVIGITGKTFDKQTGPFETGFTLPAKLTPNEQETIRNYIYDLHKALGITHGITHSELMLTQSGPRIIEVNPRLGGAHLSELYESTTGHNLYELVITALVEDSEKTLPLEINKVSQTAWVSCQKKGVVKSLAFANNIALSEGDSVQVILRKNAGDPVPGFGDNRDRVAAIIAASSTDQGLQKIIQQAKENIVLEVI